ncbi:hypothetical protein BKA62DRAFT_699206 [Auriculariales sp. MPI-PUGE-AT-0066]|nr:hypothetical protein BKA62DRAFT_699206 [Auriculariales sp. MPI-PUGE-AT-0066]
MYIPDAPVQACDKDTLAWNSADMLKTDAQIPPAVDLNNFGVLELDCDATPLVTAMLHHYTPATTPNLRVLRINISRQQLFTDTLPSRQLMLQEALLDGTKWTSLRELDFDGYVMALGAEAYTAVTLLLQRAAPTLSVLYLLPFDFDAPPEDIENLLPELGELHTLAILQKAPNLRKLIFTERLSVPGEDFQSREPDEANWDETGSTGSRATRGTTTADLRPRHLAQALLDRRLLTKTSGVRVRSLSMFPFSQAYSARACRLIAAGARIILGFPALGHVTHCMIDRWLFTALMARDVVLPEHLCVLRIMTSTWTGRDADPDVYGEQFTRLDQPFGHIAAQIQRGCYRSLRGVYLLHREDDDGLILHDVFPNRDTDEWRLFSNTCAAKRISTMILRVSELSLMEQIRAT